MVTPTIAGAMMIVKSGMPPLDEVTVKGSAFRASNSGGRLIFPLGHFEILEVIQVLRPRRVASGARLKRGSSHVEESPTFSTSMGRNFLGDLD